MTKENLTHVEELAKAHEAMAYLAKSSMDFIQRIFDLEKQFGEYRFLADQRVQDLEEALLYVARAGHGTPLNMCQKGITLYDDNGVEVKLEDGTIVKAGRTPRGPGDE